MAIRIHVSLRQKREMIRSIGRAPNNPPLQGYIFNLTPRSPRMRTLVQSGGVDVAVDCAVESVWTGFGIGSSVSEAI